MNASLCAPYTEKETYDALFQIGPLKVPGEDGFPARFLSTQLAVLKVEITAALLEFFDTGVMSEGVNDMAIVLIPKFNILKNSRILGPLVCVTFYTK